MRTFFIAIFLFLIMLLAGVVGFQFIENYTIIESIYMTVITISTVGFAEIKPLSNLGKLFTSIYILLNLGVFTYISIIFSKYLFGGTLKKNLRKIKMERKIKILNNHIILCGGGKTSYQTAIDLHNHNHPFVIIDKSEELIQELQEKTPYLYIRGNATNDEILIKAGINKAKALITTLPSDADNVFVTLTAKGINPNLKIVSKAEDIHSEVKLKRAGADNVIIPSAMGGRRMAKLVTEPDIVEFLETILVQGKDNVNLEEIYCNEKENHSHTCSIKELNTKSKSEANIIGLKTKEGTYVFNPSGNTILKKTDRLFVLGTPEQIKKLKKNFL